MKKIRKGMFETNSSSTHTIIVTDKNCEPGHLVDFEICEFGWKFARLDTVDEKASYLYTLACDCLGRDVYQDLYEMLVKYGIRCNCPMPPVFNKYGTLNCLDNGYVDHADDGDARKFVDKMLSDEKALIRYLFSPQSFVVTGNDNCDEDDYKWFEEQTDVDYKHHTYEKGN